LGSDKLPSERRQVFAAKFTLQANPVKNTKLAESVLIRVNPWFMIIEFSETSESSVAKICGKQSVKNAHTKKQK
jgi:hypothetical protein